MIQILKIRPISLIIPKGYVFIKQVPAERLSGLSGDHASRGVWGSALRAKSYKSFQNHSNLFPDKMIQILKIRPISLIIPKGYVFI